MLPVLLALVMVRGKYHVAVCNIGVVTSGTLLYKSVSLCLCPDLRALKEIGTTSKSACLHVR